MRTARSLIISLYLVVSHAPPGATMHTLPRSNHACPPEQPRMPPPEQPCMPPLGATMHAPSRSNHTRPPVNRMTNRCKNITLPQTSFAGGKKGNRGNMPQSKTQIRLSSVTLKLIQVRMDGLAILIQICHCDVRDRTLIRKMSFSLNNPVLL